MSEVDIGGGPPQSVRSVHSDRSSAIQPQSGRSIQSPGSGMSPWQYPDGKPQSMHSAHSDGSNHSRPGKSLSVGSINSIHSAHSSAKGSASPGEVRTPAHTGEAKAAASPGSAKDNAEEVAHGHDPSVKDSARGADDDDSARRVSEQWERKLADRLAEAEAKRKQQAEAAVTADAGEAEDDASQEENGSLSGHESFEQSSKSEDAWA